MSARLLVCFVFVLFSTQLFAARTHFEVAPYGGSNEWCNNSGLGLAYTVTLWNPSTVTQHITLTAYRSNAGAIGSKTPDAGTLSTDSITLAANEIYEKNWTQSQGCSTANQSPRGVRIDITENNGFIMGRISTWRLISAVLSVVEHPLNNGRAF